MPKSSKKDIEKNAKIMLEILGDKPKRRTEWTVAARKKEISTQQFDRLLTWLLEDRLVKKLEWGVYERTALGKENMGLWHRLKHAKMGKRFLRSLTQRN